MISGLYGVSLEGSVWHALISNLNWAMRYLKTKTVLLGVITSVFLVLLGGCGGGNDGGWSEALTSGDSNSANKAKTTGVVDGGESSVIAPTGLSYRELAATYPPGESVTPNTAASSGGPIDQYSVSPTLPQGLSLDSTTGEIAGTPTREQPQTTYTVTGSNAAGHVTAQVKITVAAHSEAL